MANTEERIYHRLASPTQTDAVAELQVAPRAIWGKPSFWSNRPTVTAYSGPLPESSAGTEFRTSVALDPGGAPGRPEWSGSRSGVEIAEGFAKLTCVVTKVVRQRPEKLS